VSGSGPYVDGTNLAGTFPGVVDFDNVTFESQTTAPPGGNSYVSSSAVSYCVKTNSGSTCYSTVGNLPACATAIDHQHITVKDANAACSAGSTAVGGGSTVCDEYCAGGLTAWKETGF
jgi:hypothetical protein